MYIGDAWGDFLANCAADISVWINTDHNQHWIDVVNDKTLMNKQKDKKFESELLFIVDSWT